MEKIISTAVIYSQGWEIKDIQNWLGHADIETTGNIYTQISNSREALVADNMEDMLLMAI